MTAGPASLVQKGLYWTLALVVAGAFTGIGDTLAALKTAKAKNAKSNPRADASAAADRDPLTEWELVHGAAVELREKIAKKPRDEALRQQMAELAVRSAVGAERALAIGDASLFDSYRQQFKELFHDTRWRIGRMAQQGNDAAEYAAGVLSVHGFLEPANVETACGHFRAALGKGYAGAKFRASQCLEKEDPARAASLLREAAASTAGTGVPKDFNEARRWLELAERGGIANARQLLDWIEREKAAK